MIDLENLENLENLVIVLENTDYLKILSGTDTI